MVGFKTFWISIFALFLFAACVPQTKQTDCGANEAFNSSLRSCVPVTPGPSAFVNISSYAPASAVTKYKDDFTPMTFQVTVNNPYNQSYSIEWERVFNGTSTTMCGNALTCSFTASYLGTTLGEIGSHVLIAKIKNTSGSTVDSHNFLIQITNLPKPVISTVGITPNTYSVEKYPTDPRVQFSFTIKNNGTTMSVLDGYKTTWTVTKNGNAVPALTEEDPFTNFTTTGSNTTYLGTSVTPSFNPATLGVGYYQIRAVVSNDVPGEVVDERQWTLTIKHPDLGNVSTISQPSPGTSITAHNGINYTQFPTYSWIYGASNTQPNFCVTLDDADGTYAGDTKGVQVKFYLNSLGADICTKESSDTPGTQTICLNDANLCDDGAAGVAFDPSILSFTNSSSTATQNHKVTARLFDKATNQEFQSSDITPSNGTYPIEWTVVVKPTNTAPVVTFGTTNPTGCAVDGQYARKDCAVTQGTNFTVSFQTTDDFYSPSADPEEFKWNVALKLNGADITSPDVAVNTSCSKDFGTAVTVPAASGPYVTQWTCTLQVPHYTASGPLDPTSGAYTVVATMEDSGSPVGGSGLASPSLTWKLKVSEANSGISIAPQTALLADSHVALGVTVLDPTTNASYATEKDTVTFRLNVTDNEVDNFKYRISLCTTYTPTTCPTSIPITSPSYIDFLRSIQTVPSTNPVLVTGLLYTLPEDLLLQISPIQDVSTAAGDAQLVYFKVDVVDTPSAPLTPTVTDSEIFSFYVRNYNPAPVINTATASPAVGSTTVVYSGFPFTIDPGTVTDAGPASETTILYQWYADNGGGFEAISGATSRILRFTPGNGTTNITLKLCVGDRPAANPVSSTGTCSGTWTVTPKRYLETLAGTGLADMTDATAVWYDDANAVANTEVIYSAYTGDDDKIYVEKTIKNTSGNLNVSTETVSFNILPGGGSPDTVSNLSLAGDANNLYIAYLASVSSAPANMVPRIRRISKDFSNGSKTALEHSAPFGFNYAHYTLTATCSGVTCTVTNGDGAGTYASISFTSAVANGTVININGRTFTAAGASPLGMHQFCDNTVCATGNSTATSLAGKINGSTDSLVKGIVAEAVGSEVRLYGQYHNDYLDFDGNTAGIPGIVALQGGLGKLIIAGNYWHLPIINSSLAGTQQNNITVITGRTDYHLRDINLGLDFENDLLDMGKVRAFDAKLNAAGELVFARISLNSNHLGLFRYVHDAAGSWTLLTPPGAPSTERESMDIFGSYDFEYVKLATDTTGNPYYYVLAREESSDGGEYHIGRYDPTLDSAVTPSENFISTQLVTTDSTDDVISDSKMMAPDIVSIPGTQTARIFFHSVGTGATTHPRIAYWRSDDTVSCGTCESLSGTNELLSTSVIGVSQVAEDITLGAAGATASENIRDVVFTLFSTFDGTNYKPQLGIINVQAEAIQSTSVDPTNLWRPPFVLD
jgi:hypothetical protein